MADEKAFANGPEHRQAYSPERGQEHGPGRGPEFLYESNATSSFLVICLKEKITGYRAGMLGRNRIRHVISPEITCKEGVNRLYYNITSMIPLSFYLKRRKFSKEQLLLFFLDMASFLQHSAGYLLDVSNFIFDTDYVFINPENLEPSFVCVPAATGRQGCGALQEFVSDLLLMHINAKGFDDGNFVQRILSAVRSETFNLKGFSALVNELLYGCERNTASDEPGRDDSRGAIWQDGSRSGSFRQEESSADINKAILKREKQEIFKNSRKGARMPVKVVLGVLLQFAMGGIVFFCRGFLESAGENPIATYAAVILGIAAADILVLKKLASKGKPAYGGNPANFGGDTSGEDYGGSSEMCEPAAASPGNPAAAIAGGRASYAGHPVERRKTLPAMGCIPATAGEAPPGRNGAPAVRGESPSAGSAIPAASGNMQPIPVAIPKNPGEKGSCRTEFLGDCLRGIRVLKSTGRQNGDEDIIIDRDEIIVGRLAGHVDHVIRNGAVGKIHAEITLKNGSCYVKDLNSMNGTFINDNRLASNKEYELKANDRLRLANSEYVLVVP